MTDTIETWWKEELAKAAIRDLAATYQRGCDGGWGLPSHGDPSGLAELFTEGGSYKIPQNAQAAVGRAEITAVFEELQSSLPSVIHYLTNEQIDLHGDRADVRFNGFAAIWSAAGKRQLAFGVYTGTVVREEGRWLFQSWQFDLAGPPSPSPAA